MKVPLTALRAFPLAFGLVAALGPSAFAELDVDVSFEGVGDLEDNLPDRLGYSLNAQEHFINIEDCELYGSDSEIDVTFGGLSEFAALEYTYALMYAAPDGSCPTTSTNPEATAGCFIAISNADLDSSTVTMTVELDELISDACDSNSQGIAHLYIVVQENGATAVDTATVDIEVDLDRPDAPVVTSVTSGDARFNVEWEDDGAEDGTEYRVYWSTEQFADTDAEGLDFKGGFDGTSATIDSGLENGVSVFVAVVAVDEADNESVLSNSESVTPEQTEDFWERYQTAGGTEEGGFCFIATAAYGTTLEPELDTLRAFRDQMLLPTEGGSAFVASYYQHGRRWAAFIADKPVLRSVVRVLLVPVVLIAKLVLAVGPYVSFVLLLGAVALFRWARRRVTRGPFSFPTPELG